jgi:CheY-like chemotaxis protein
MPNTHTILVVDDDPDVTLWLSKLLHHYQWGVIVAGDGIQAMSMVRHQHPDLVLVDLNMPAGSGLFVLESLKKHVDYQTIPVVVMSGDPGLEPELFLRRGADACLAKTADAQTLVQTISSLLGPPVLPTESTTTIAPPAPKPTPAPAGGWDSERV